MCFSLGCLLTSQPKEGLKAPDKLERLTGGLLERRLNLTDPQSPNSKNEGLSLGLDTCLLPPPLTLSLEVGGPQERAAGSAPEIGKPQRDCESLEPCLGLSWKFMC